MTKETDKQIILLVEDEESLAAGLEYNLKKQGYSVIWAKDGQEALGFYQKKQPDLVILDIMLPYKNGFEVAESILENSPRMPILMLTARADVKDKLRGLETGVNDYMTKPFHLRELIIRIKGMLRRKEWYSSEAHKNPVYTFGENEVNFDKLTARHGQIELKLTYHEAMVLKYLIDNKDRAVERGELLKNVWNLDSEIETRTVDNFISRLRKHFEQNPSSPVFIKSVRSVGYMFTDEV